MATRDEGGAGWAFYLGFGVFAGALATAVIAFGLFTDAWLATAFGGVVALGGTVMILIGVIAKAIVVARDTP